jgi:dipeptidyl aminopeptidase/acylaminoacyl peptidase
VLWFRPNSPVPSRSVVSCHAAGTVHVLSRSSLARIGLILLTVCGAVFASSASVAEEANSVESRISISITDAAGRKYSLARSISEEFNHSGGIEPSHDGSRLAFSVQTFPILDEQHPKSAADVGVFSDGTPSDRRGNRLMIIDTSERRGGDGRARLLGAPDADTWSPSWAPDDRSIAYYSNEGGAVQVWLYDVERGSHRRISDDRIRVQLGTAMDAPSWSSDGSTVFVSKVTARVKDGAQARPDPYRRSSDDGSDARVYFIEHSDRDIASSTLVSIDVATGKEISLPSHGAINILHSLSRSPSGNWLAALTDDFQLSAIDLPSRESHSLGEMTVLEYRYDYYAGPFWNPRSDTLAYVSGNQLMVLDLTHGFSAPRVVGSNLDNIPWHFDGSKGTFFDTMNPPAFSSDGRKILALVLRNDVPFLRVIPVDGSKATEIALRGGLAVRRGDGQAIELEVTQIDLLRVRENQAWQPVRDHVFVQYADYDSAETVIDDVDIATGQVRTVRRVHAEFRIVGEFPNGDAIALYQNFFTPGNFYRLTKDLKLEGRPIVPLEVPSTALSVLRSARLSVISTVVPSRQGKLRKLTAAIIRPAGSDKYLGPVVVAQYPGAQGFWEINQFSESLSQLSALPLVAFLANGYTVMLPHTLGVGPYRQPMEPVETRGLIDSLLPQIYRAADLGLFDIRRVGVIGESQGGHAAVALTTGTHLFGAAVSINGVRFAPLDRYSSLSGDSFHYLDAKQLGDGLVNMLDNAPYFRAANVLTPVMLVHGDADPTFHSSELMAEAFRQRAANFVFVPYHNMGHDCSLWPQAEQTDLTTRVLGFFNIYLRHDTPDARP